MSEYIQNKFEEREDLNLLLGARTTGGSSSHYNSLWMTHWTNHRRVKESDLSVQESTKARVSGQFIINTIQQNGTHSNTEGNLDFYFSGKTVISNTQVDSCQITNSNPENWDHFPMYGKRKIESILKPKGKAKYEDDDDDNNNNNNNNNFSEFNVTFASSKEYKFEAKNNNNLAQITSCSCTEEGNFSTSSQTKCLSHFDAETQSVNSIGSGFREHFFTERSQSLTRDSGQSSGKKRKSVSLFEMVTLPSSSCDVQFERKSKSCEDYCCDFDGITGNRFVDKNENKSENKNENVVMDIPRVSSAFGGLASSRGKKVATFPNPNPNPTKSDSTQLVEVKPCLDKETVSLSLNADVILTHSKNELKISNSTEIIETLANTQANTRWLKRLRHNSIYENTPAVKSMRLKTGKETSTTSLFSPLPEYHTNNSDKRCKFPEKCDESNGIGEECIRAWIQRWCSKKFSPTHGDDDDNKDNNNNKNNDENVIQEVLDLELEGKQFPSIAAMAMMGKAMSKFRPCEFQRQGPSVVWNSSNGF